MGIKNEIIKKIESAKVKPFDDLVFKKNTYYIRELPATKKGPGFTSTVEITLVTDSKDSHLYERMEEEIGFHGIYGSYGIQLITYNHEDAFLALDNLWTRKLTLQIIWETL